MADADQPTRPEWAPPDDLYRAVAAARAERWGYTSTLDSGDLTLYIDHQSKDHNLRADVDAVWLYAWPRVDQAERAATSLAETARYLENYIYAKADEIASERIADARQRAQETVNGLTGRYQADRQRWADLEAELRRQLDVQLRQVDVLRKRLRDAGLDPNTGLPAHEPTREQP